MTPRASIVSDAELRARAADLARVVEDDETAGADLRGLLIVRLGRERIGVDVRCVREVIAEPHVTPLPMAPQFVAGVMNLRGEIIGVLDLSRLLSVSASATAAAVVVQHDGVSAALRVDAVDEVVWFAASAREPLITTVPAATAPLFDGAFRAGTQMITALNIPEILALPQRDASAGEAAAR